jgi:hypothetical protein
MFIFFCLFWGCNANCKALTNEQQDLAYILQVSFEKIYLAKYGLDYPHTKHALDRCIQHDDRQCLDSYNQVAEGKNTIASLADSKALEITLDVIERACLSNNEKIANVTCYGGIMSLYFYNSPEQDAKIRTRIKKYPKKIRNMIFNSDFLWYSNRPDVNAWVDYISSADVDWEPKTQKQYISTLFRKNIKEVDEDQWVSR